MSIQGAGGRRMSSGLKHRPPKGGAMISLAFQVKQSMRARMDPVVQRSDRLEPLGSRSGGGPSGGAVVTTRS
jgi:hypothetical protein